MEIFAGKNAWPSSRKVGKSCRIERNTVVSVVAQSLINHRLLDTEYPLNLFDLESFDVTEVWDTLLEIARDMATRHIVIVENKGTTSTTTVREVR